MWWHNFLCGKLTTSSYWNKFHLLITRCASVSYVHGSIEHRRTYFGHWEAAQKHCTYEGVWVCPLTWICAERQKLSTRFIIYGFSEIDGTSYGCVTLCIRIGSKCWLLADCNSGKANCHRLKWDSAVCHAAIEKSALSLSLSIAVAVNISFLFCIYAQWTQQIHIQSVRASK